MTTLSSDSTEPAFRGLFDHAGMFPPAAKPMHDALTDAAGFSKVLLRPGMVGADLVVTWKDWPFLTAAALAKACFVGTCHVAIVGVAQENAAAVAEQIARHNAGTSSTPVVSLEIHSDGDLDESALRAAKAKAPNLSMFIEPRWPSARVAAHVGHVALLAKALGLGLKVRCAGPTALDPPALAASLRFAADAAIAFKATQGLHHPVPGDGFVHGFFGLLAAFRLRQALGPKFDEISDCLAERDAQAFNFDDGISWRQYTVAGRELAKFSPFAIGSCSLTEPDEDLLHVLGPPVAAR